MSNLSNLVWEKRRKVVLNHLCLNFTGCQRKLRIAGDHATAAGETQCSGHRLGRRVFRWKLQSLNCFFSSLSGLWIKKTEREEIPSFLDSVVPSCCFRKPNVWWVMTIFVDAIKEACNQGVGRVTTTLAPPWLKSLGKTSPYPQAGQVILIISCFFPAPLFSATCDPFHWSWATW